MISALKHYCKSINKFINNFGNLTNQIIGSTFRYKPERKFKGLVTLIRAEQGAAREEDVGPDYGISQVIMIPS